MQLAFSLKSWESAPPTWWPHRPWSSSPSSPTTYRSWRKRSPREPGASTARTGRRVREWGHRRVNEPTALEISKLAEQVRAGAVQRRNARGGRGAAEHLIGALLARRDPETQTISLVLDDTTANVALFAIAAHADEREAHIREVERSGQNLPEGSYGRRNRQAIAARETRVAARLRAVEQAYRTATEHGTASRPPEPTRTFRSPERQADREMELE